MNGYLQSSTAWNYKSMATPPLSFPFESLLVKFSDSEYPVGTCLSPWGEWKDSDWSGGQAPHYLCEMQENAPGLPASGSYNVYDIDAQGNFFQVAMWEYTARITDVGAKRTGDSEYPALSAADAAVAVAAGYKGRTDGLFVCPANLALGYNGPFEGLSRMAWLSPDGTWIFGYCWQSTELFVSLFSPSGLASDIRKVVHWIGHYRQSMDDQVPGNSVTKVLNGPSLNDYYGVYVDGQFIFEQNTGSGPISQVAGTGQEICARAPESTQVPYVPFVQPS